MQVVAGDARSSSADSRREALAGPATAAHVGRAMLKGLGLAAILIGLCMAFLAADPAHASMRLGAPHADSSDHLRFIA
jgi:hypothetical protein